MSEFRVNSTHLETLGDGRMVEPGQDVSKVDAKDPHNQALIDAGILVAKPSRRRQSKRTKSTSKETSE